MRKYTRIQIYMAVIYLVIVLAILFVSYSISVQTLLERQENMLEIRVENTALEVDLFYADFIYAVDDIASFIETFGLGDLNQYLVSKHEHHEYVASMYFGTLDNVLYNSTGFIPPVGFDLTTRIWYQMALNQQDTIITPAFLNASQDFYITTIAKPVYDNDVFLGVAAIDINIEVIRENIRSKNVFESGYVLLIDSDNQIIAYPQGWEVEDAFLSMDDAQIDASILDAHEVIHNFWVLGQKGSAIHKDIALGAYHLILFVPNEEFNLAPQRFLTFFIFFFVVTSIFGSLFIVFNVTYIVKPLSRLDQDLHEIDLRKHIKYRLPITKHEHFSEIKETLNKTLDTTEAYFDENVLTTQQLHLENQRIKLLIDSTQDFILQIDLNYEVVYASGIGLKKMNLKPEDMMGQSVFLSLHDEEKIHKDKITEAIKGIHSLYDWSYSGNGDRMVYETSVSPIYDDHKRIIGVVSISRDITEAKKKQEEIEYINAHDYLTGLYNRRAFQEMFETSNALANFPVSIMMLDLNGLKLINDAFGHAKGDRALVLVAGVLEHHLKDHFVARVGGDEFSAILKNTTKEEVEKIKQKITSDVQLLYVESIQLSISVGFETIDEVGMDFNTVIKSAENNMYRQKITESMSIRNNAIRAILKTLTDKYAYERIHSEKVSQLCYVTGLELNLSIDQLKELRLAGMYHDIGKIAIPDAILDKPDVLTHEEYEVMKSHTEIGYNILRAADAYSKLAEYALTHHERWDGKGYPNQLKEDEIPLFSRIISLADTFDAMTTNRPYRRKLSKDQAVAEIIKHAGTQFDPELAKVFVTQVLKRPWKTS